MMLGLVTLGRWDRQGSQLDKQPDRRIFDAENNVCCQVQGGHRNKGNKHARER